MGLGGNITVLQCHIEHADTHMTLNPVAVNYQCWAARRASAHIGPTAPSTTTGSSEIDMPQTHIARCRPPVGAVLAMSLLCATVAARAASAPVRTSP